MKKISFILGISLFLIVLGNVKAAECQISYSYSITPLYIGETGKLKITIKNPCEISVRVRTEVLTGQTFGYIKVYYVEDETQTPHAVRHEETYGTTAHEFSLDEGSTEEVVYFVQPDEKTPTGNYILYLKIYADNDLIDTREIRVMVSDPLPVTYSIPSSIKLNMPQKASVKVNNRGSEIMDYIKIYLSSPNGVVKFSQWYYSWSDFPPQHSDTFEFMITSNVKRPDDYQDAVEVRVEYKTYTGLLVTKSYTLPWLKITPYQEGPPSLSYRVEKTDENLTFFITNNGKSVAFECILKLNTPTDCKLSSDALEKFTPSLEKNVYELKCGDEIDVDEYTSTVIYFNRSELTRTCYITGTISFKDTYGKSYQVQVGNVSIRPLVTTTVYQEEKRERSIYPILGTILILIVLIYSINRIRKKERLQRIKKVEEEEKEIIET